LAGQPGYRYCLPLFIKERVKWVLFGRAADQSAGWSNEAVFSGNQGGGLYLWRGGIALPPCSLPACCCLLHIFAALSPAGRAERCRKVAA